MTTRKYSRWKDGIYDSKVELAATKYWMNNDDKLFHKMVANLKGPDKVVYLLRNKPK